MKTVLLPCGEAVPALGMGTWNMGDAPSRRADELATLRLGLDLGCTLVDTAEMYGEGLSEELVGEALQGRRNEAFIVTKVYPHNASKAGTVAACERSLRRLRTDRIDLYLLHWRGSVPLAETMQALMALQKAGKIRHYGVSNLDLADMQELWKVPGGQGVQTNQLLYNLTRRGIEWDLLPWLRERSVPVMAYSPIEQARLLHHNGLAHFARRHDVPPAQAALAWLLAQDGVIAIPKASHPDRLRENVAAAQVQLSDEQLAELDALFKPPSRATPLEML
ncbi:Aldo/keto reductase [Polaromonas sp. YR568]|uniref:aldo/keto reductase n=1 Tax=Polaromonas sp. YR568 TaxID=1855301 RepID=UPI0008F3FA34|nr:aldo/keto reductase [Polaromonas sp. YR568]SFU77825.1 Aldo/keto reductase [Polaromonas sp. YR568]